MDIIITKIQECVLLIMNIVRKMSKLSELEMMQEPPMLSNNFKHSLTSFTGKRRSQLLQDEGYKDIFAKSPNCTKLEASCKKGGSFSSYLDCLEWFISCQLVIVN